jgi:hypothetical protein
MPIRFRCVYCNQLLGISRRKAGMTVRCTTCDGQLIVPDPNAASTELADEGLPPQPPQSVTKEPPPHKGSQLFERDDFGDVLEPFQFRSSPAAVANSPAPSSSVRTERPSFPTLPTAPPVTDPGLVLNRKQVTLASVLIVLGLGLSFAIGLWVGLSLR